MSKRTIKIEESALGLIAWCGEFISEVNDLNGRSIREDFFQFLAELQSTIKDESRGALEIPDICTDKDAVQVIDELMYRLKFVAKSDNNPIATALWKGLNELVKSGGLGSDPHSFASLPKAYARSARGVLK